MDDIGVIIQQMFELWFSQLGDWFSGGVFQLFSDILSKFVAGA